MGTFQKHSLRSSGLRHSPGLMLLIFPSPKCSCIRIKNSSQFYTISGMYAKKPVKRLQIIIWTPAQVSLLAKCRSITSSCTGVYTVECGAAVVQKVVEKSGLVNFPVLYKCDRCFETCQCLCQSLVRALEVQQILNASKTKAVNSVLLMFRNPLGAEFND